MRDELLQFILLDIFRKYLMFFYRSWSFCGTGNQACDKKNGSYLDYSIEVKGMTADDKIVKANIQTGKKGKSIGKNPITYQMGDGFITLSPSILFACFHNILIHY